MTDQTITDENETVTDAPKKQNWFARHKILTGVGAVAVIAIAMNTGGGDEAPAEDDAATVEQQIEDAADAEVDEVDEAQPAADAEADEADAAAEVVVEDEPENAKPEAPSKEAEQALEQAESYLEFSSFSEAGLFDQLTSDYGSQFTDEAATWALENVEVNWKDEALEQAQSYIDTMPFSEAGLYDQMTSEYGSQFTAKQAEYAVANVEVDWMAEAVEQAESYLDTMTFSRAGLIDQMTSEYGSQFTQAQAEHAANQVGF
ncbi:Ltp family lipoprotein [Demequina mangrovi]|uniref:Host cell surface-exposed lipoprotein n=1 Tax=Demequina mangrovi TaxID=1043493 RepID=A0A1H6ZZB9_9MICO|nr:Ltp family lipoprotein [Demequina mangrovi]SEJ57534.1 Host cell surface-exposed lipoprotein [Demequina mangrovi]